MNLINKKLITLNSKSWSSFSTRVLCVFLNRRSSPSLPLLCLQHILSSLHYFLWPLLKPLVPFLIHFCLISLLLHFLLSLLLHIALSLNLDNTQISTHSCFQNKVILFGLCWVGIIHYQTSWKAWFHGCWCYHFELILSIRIKLQYCSSSNL